MLFGGMNLTTYNESEIYEIHVDDNKVIEYLSQPPVLKPDQRQKVAATIGDKKAEENGADKFNSVVKDAIA